MKHLPLPKQLKLVHPIKEVMKINALNISVPLFSLQLLLGEQAAIVLEGANVSSVKIQQKGFVFKYPELNGALKQLLQKK